MIFELTKSTLSNSLKVVGGVALAAIVLKWLHRMYMSSRASALSWQDEACDRQDHVAAGKRPAEVPPTVALPTPSAAAANEECADDTTRAKNTGNEQRLPPRIAVVDSAERRQALELFHALKLDANRCFQHGRLDEAMEGYQNAVDVLAALPVSDHEVVELAQGVRANVVLVFLKQERYEEARMVATFLLQDDIPLAGELQSKVLYRRAMAMIKLGDLEGAHGDLQAAQHFLARSDPLIEAELVKVRKMLEQQ